MQGDHEAVPVDDVGELALGDVPVDAVPTNVRVQKAAGDIIALPAQMVPKLIFRAVGTSRV